MYIYMQKKIFNQIRNIAYPFTHRCIWERHTHTQRMCIAWWYSTPLAQLSDKKGHTPGAGSSKKEGPDKMMSWGKTGWYKDTLCSPIYEIFKNGMGVSLAWEGRGVELVIAPQCRNVWNPSELYTWDLCTPPEVCYTSTSSFVNTKTRITIKMRKPASRMKI